MARIPKLRLVILRPSKMMLITQTTAELVEDAGPEFSAQLTQSLINAGSWALDDAVVNGTGVGKVLGLMNSPAKVVVAKESTQTAATINSTNVMKMWARLHPLCAQRRVAGQSEHPAAVVQDGRGRHFQ